MSLSFRLSCSVRAKRSSGLLGSVSVIRGVEGEGGDTIGSLARTMRESARSMAR